MVTLPPYFLRRPPVRCDGATVNAMEAFYRSVVAAGNGGEIEYTLDVPKWQFLCHVCESDNVVLHGSGRADITLFEPRKANDLHPFGDRCAVYAAADGIWPLFFATVDREKGVTSLLNGCFRVWDEGALSAPYYFFSINADALARSPWRSGTIYLLPGDGFERQPREAYRNHDVEIAQCARLSPVAPLARLAVVPEDFPFLRQVVPHDPALLSARAAADPAGFPWLEE